MTGQKLSTVLAALRYYQSRLDKAPTPVIDIATNEGEYPLMTRPQIDALCERLNTADTTITIRVEGGIIQSIEDIPPGMQVQVFDYDIDGVDSPETDDSGEECVKTVWME